MDLNELGSDWADPAPARWCRASLQDLALGIPQSQAARQGQATQTRANAGERQHQGAAQPPASPAAALLPSGFKGHHLMCKGKKKTNHRIDLPEAPWSSKITRVSMETKLVK